MPQFLIAEHYYGKRYIEVVKKRSAIPTFFLQPLMPQFLIAEHYYGKQYKIIFIKKLIFHYWYNIFTLLVSHS